MTWFDASGPGPLVAVALAVAVAPRVGAGSAGRAAGRAAALSILAAASVSAALAGHVVVLAGGWLVAGIAASQLAREARLAAAWAFLGDAIAVAGFAALAVDSGHGALPWAGGPAASTWVTGMVIAGVGLRAAVLGTQEPAVLVLGIGVLLPITPFVPTTGLAVLVLAAPAGLVLVGLGRLTAAVPLLAVAAWAPGHPLTSAAASVLLAGGLVAAAASAFASHQDAMSPRRIRIRGIELGGPVGQPAGAVPAAVALVVALAVLLSTPPPLGFDRSLLLLAWIGAALAVVALAAGGAPGPGGRRADGAAAVLTTSFALVPTAWSAAALPATATAVRDAWSGGLAAGRWGLGTALVLGVVAMGSAREASRRATRPAGATR